MSACFLIDDLGDVQFGAHSARRRRFLTAEPNLVDVAHQTTNDDTLQSIIETGLVEWRAHEGHVRIRLRPSMITPQAFDRIISWIRSEQPQRVLISYYVSGNWEYEYFLSPRACQQRLEQLVRDYGALGSGALRTRRLPLTAQVNVDKFEQVIAYWQSHRDQFDPAAALRYIDPVAAGRWVLFEQPTPNDYCISDFGARTSVYVQKWLRRSLGEPLSSAPDKRYARATEEVYRSVAAAFEPRLEDVDTMVSWPGYGRMRNRYQRLMLPFKSTVATRGASVEKNWHLTITIMDPKIDLLD